MKLLAIVAISLISLFVTAAASTYTTPPTFSTSTAVTYRSQIHTPQSFLKLCRVLSIKNFRLVKPTPLLLEEFSGTDLSVHISIAHALVLSFAKNHSATGRWVRTHILPFHRRLHITAISAGVLHETEMSASETAITETLQGLEILRNSLFIEGVCGIHLSPVLSIRDFAVILPPLKARLKENRNQLFDYAAIHNSPIVFDISPFYPYGELAAPLGLFLFTARYYRFDITFKKEYSNLSDVLVDATVLSRDHNLQFVGNVFDMLVDAMVGSTAYNLQFLVTAEARQHNRVSDSFLYFEGLLNHCKRGRVNRAVDTVFIDTIYNNMSVAGESVSVVNGGIIQSILSFFYRVILFCLRVIVTVFLVYVTIGYYLVFVHVPPNLVEHR